MCLRRAKARHDLGAHNILAISLEYLTVLHKPTMLSSGFGCIALARRQFMIRSAKPISRFGQDDRLANEKKTEPIFSREIEQAGV
jgi:hypothetical protein